MFRDIICDMRRLLIILAFLLMSSPFALAHDWYPYYCCGGKDCHPVGCDELIDDNEGNVKYNEYLFTKGQVQPSQDNKCHVCIADNYDGSKRPTCVFTLQGF
jgi:hypothetical protein